MRKVTSLPTLQQHWTNKKGVMKPKRAFKTLDEVLSFIKDSKIDDGKYHPYVCAECGMWHIGHHKSKKRKR